MARFEPEPLFLKRFGVHETTSKTQRSTLTEIKGIALVQVEVFIIIALYHAKNAIGTPGQGQSIQ